MSGWHLLTSLHAPSWHETGTWLVLVSLAILVPGCISLYRTNRLLFRCLMWVVAGHLIVGGCCLAVGHVKAKPREIRVAITTRFQKDPPTPKEEPKPQPDKPLAIPFGRSDGDRNVKKVRKGTTTKTSAPGNKSFGNHNSIATPTDAGDGEVIDDPLADKDVFGGGNSLNPDDIGKMGTGGDDGGVKDGDPSGGIPRGFSNGKIDGRVYFIRLNYGSGDWNAYDTGTKRLLAFLTQYFPCETDSRAMTSAELRDRYLSKGAQPSFIYMYCGSDFSLSNTDVQILQEYMRQGGFLFLDSRPNRDIKNCVAREMGRLLSGARLTTITPKHAINSFLFKLAGPGVGENLLTKENYGVERNGRLVVFYTMGNFSHMYWGADAKSNPYVTVTYQMGANVMVYAINKGSTDGIVQRDGARAEMTTETINKLFNAGEPASASPQTSGESVKIKRPPAADGSQPTNTDMPDEPDDIKLLN